MEEQTHKSLSEAERSNPKDVTRQEARRESLAKKLRYTEQLYPSPSKCASNATAAGLQCQVCPSEGLPSFQQDKLPFVANGGCVVQHCPTALVHPAFGRAIDGLERHPDDLSAEDWDLYMQLENVLPYYYDSEKNLQNTVIELLNRHAAQRRLPPVVALERTDGVILGPLSEYLCIMEFKVRQDVAEMQVTRYYFDYISNCERRRIAPAYLTSLPCASIEIVGNEIRLGAHWMEERIAVARLGAAELRWDQSPQQRRYAASLVSSWIHLVKELRDDYRDLDCQLDQEGWPAPEGPVEFKAPIPYPLTTERFSLTDAEVLVPYRLYRARHKTSGQVMVKFVDCFYCQEAHEAWIAAGVAVEATFEPLPGGYTMVVMPELSQHDGWFTYADLSPEEQRLSRGDLLKLIAKAHAPTADGRIFVHGDCRRTNILAQKCPSTKRITQLRLVDFDWTGVAGKTRYRVVPNELLGPDRRRPKWVKLGVRLATDHDYQTIRACFGSLWDEGDVAATS